MKFILDAISEYLTVKVRRSDVLSTWAGLRPLASDPNAADTESASRDHIVTRDPDGLLTVTGLTSRVCHASHSSTPFDKSHQRCCQRRSKGGAGRHLYRQTSSSNEQHCRDGLLQLAGLLLNLIAPRRWFLSNLRFPSACSILPMRVCHLVCKFKLEDVAGGKWTTYRLMAQDAVDEIVKSGKVRTMGECCTVHMPLVGAQGFNPALFTEVAQNYTVPHRPGAIDTNVAKHLSGRHSISDPAGSRNMKSMNSAA